MKDATFQSVHENSVLPVTMSLITKRSFFLVFKVNKKEGVGGIIHIKLYAAISKYRSDLHSIL